MNVKELIDKLKQIKNQEANVEFETSVNECVETFPVDRVTELDSEVYLSSFIC